jgi:hypothetical protein
MIAFADTVMVAMRTLFCSASLMSYVDFTCFIVTFWNVACLRHGCVDRVGCELSGLLCPVLVLVNPGSLY